MFKRGFIQNTVPRCFDTGPRWSYADVVGTTARNRLVDKIPLYGEWTPRRPQCSAGGMADRCSRGWSVKYENWG